MNAPYKGTGPTDAKYAHGGECVTSRSRFMKVPDPFRTDFQQSDYDKKGKGGKLSKLDSDPSKAFKKA